mmetsp:Transcript_38416/g.115118  ORF Transcript_38416/g.115118 Transcript_38416/m.115118 type:complete len:473 (-) Transcript_38416:577-1995(-)
MEHPRRQRRLDVRLLKDVREMLRLTGAAAGNDGDGNGVADGLHEGVIETVALTVHIDAIEHDLAGAERFGRSRHGHGADIAGLPSSLDGALIPAVSFSVRTGLTLVQFHDRVLGVVPLLLGVQVHPPRIDRYDHGLHPVHRRYGLDGRLPRLLPPGFDQRLRGDDRVAPDAHLIGPRAKIAGRHLDGRIDPVGRRIAVAPYPSPHGQRYEDALGRFLQHLQHGKVADDALTERRNVEEGDFVGPLAVVAGGEGDGLAEVAHSAPAGGGGCRVPLIFVFADVVLIPLGHDEISGVVGAYVERDDDALDQLGLGLRIDGEGGGLGQGAVLHGLQKSLDDIQTGPSALLGMELRRHHGPPLHGADVPLPPVRRGRQYPLLVRLPQRRVVRMDEVHLLAVVDMREYGAVLMTNPAVPADVRDGPDLRIVESHDRPRNRPQPRQGFVRSAGGMRLLARFEQSLHAEAYSEVRPIAIR